MLTISEFHLDCVPPAVFESDYGIFTYVHPFSTFPMYVNIAVPWVASVFREFGDAFWPELLQEDSAQKPNEEKSLAFLGRSAWNSVENKVKLPEVEGPYIDIYRLSH